MGVVIGRKDGAFIFFNTCGIETGHPETLVSHNLPCPTPHAMQDRSVLVSAKPFAVSRDGDGDVDVVIGREDGICIFFKTIWH